MSTELIKTKGASISAPTTPMQLLQLAVEREGSIDVIERLAKLQTEMLDREARIAYIGAFEEFKRNAPSIVKDAAITVKDEVRGRYAKLDQVCDKLIPALLSVGITHRWQTESTADGRISVTCFLRHRLGHEERGSNLVGPPDQSGSKNPVQAIGSTTAYFERYTLVASCGIAVKDQDKNGGNKAGGIPENEQVAQIDNIANASNLDELKRIYFAAYKDAERVGDQGAMGSYEKAKNKRRGELAR